MMPGRGLTKIADYTHGFYNTEKQRKRQMIPWTTGGPTRKFEPCAASHPVAEAEASDSICKLESLRPRKSEGDSTMPYVNIKITREGVTPEQKAKLIQGVTGLLVDVLGKNPHTTVVVIDEVGTDNWGIAGEPVTRRRRRGQ
jgi:4-oxalocrotonate tautomerase